MKKCIVDESAEVVEAIDKNDIPNLEEELGDLLFNILLIAQIASEKGDFDMKSVMEKIGEKIVSRHTWVFGTDKASTPEEALALWKRIRKRKNEKLAIKIRATKKESLWTALVNSRAVENPVSFFLMRATQICTIPFFLMTWQNQLNVSKSHPLT